jgi:ribose-phosphate pyrophosphokinase
MKNVINLGFYFDKEPKNNIPIKVDSFPSGFEKHITVPWFRGDTVIFFSGFGDIMALSLVVDAVRRMWFDHKCSFKLELALLYIPYARQDRVCNPGESLSIKVFADMINSLNFDKVYSFDPHSDVSTALINNLELGSTARFNETCINDFFGNNAVKSVCCPDASAAKKFHTLHSTMGLSLTNIIEATKHRVVKTGELSGFSIPNESVPKKILLIDDICDGGGTFIGVAKELKKKGAEELGLCVSHGIFSKGFPTLREHFTKIYCTNSIATGQLSRGNIILKDLVKVINIHDNILE